MKIRMNNKTFGSNIGEGIGCFTLILGAAIFFSFDKVLDLIGFALGRCK